MWWKPTRVTPATVVSVLAAVVIGAAFLSGCQFLLAPVTYKLTVNVVGQGSVTRSPNQTSYEAGQAVTLQADPADGWAFSQWSGDASGTNATTTVTLNSDAIITATFVEEGAELELEIIIDGEGTVSRDPDQDGYEEGDEVELTADPADGWVFSEWGGDASGTSLTTTITIDDDPSVTATFVEGGEDAILELSGEYTGVSDAFYGTFELDYSFTNEGNTTVTLSSASYTIFGSAGAPIAITETKDTLVLATLAPGETVNAELDGYSSYIPCYFEFEITYGDTYGNSRTQSLTGAFTVN